MNERQHYALVWPGVKVCAGTDVAFAGQAGFALTVSQPASKLGMLMLTSEANRALKWLISPC